MTKHASGCGSFFVRRIFIPGAVVLMLCGGAKAQKSSAPEKGKSDEDKKVEIRNNAASLLADLLGDEKNLGKILIIKHPAPGVDKLVKEIAKTAGDEGDELEKMANDGKALNLQAMQLPPGETATRSAISRTKEHELLFSSGTEFEVNLLLTQTDALEYGSHLARVGGERGIARARKAVSRDGRGAGWPVAPRGRGHPGAPREVAFCMAVVGVAPRWVDVCFASAILPPRFFQAYNPHHRSTPGAAANSLVRDLCLRMAWPACEDRVSGKFCV